eukprot:11737646-Karenia_brevis.AAC.1
MASCIAKGIGKRNKKQFKKKYLHIGFGCSPEGRRDRWVEGAPRLTILQVFDMLVAAAKEPLYESSMEDPVHPQ